MNSNTRKAELAANLERVRARIARAAAGRPAEPDLIVVTKFFPASDVALLHDLGVRDVGENRDQEAAAKAAELAGRGLRWHFIGQLQTNKAKSVVRYADLIHSVDRPQLVRALGKAMATEQERRQAAGLERRAALGCLIQVDLDETDLPQAAGTAARGGARPEEIRALATALQETEGLTPAGLMAVAPLGADPARAFDRLAEFSQLLRQEHPGADMISAGMSQDLEAAVAAGATHLRVGSDVLGPRPAVR
ncbi:YggS family pyridoxal phosphate-dependent enzyme [Arthrobacter sp. CAU 1506]|uniref:YggS family pyridoxal phosphate-dependent enzyme n=1 Tax=Arthrobacter sp. CAU 1506 TaxID=2560052 RepID=UPI0010AC79C7|nr:YggS family pyridoxal phosphate-dependent enzyme [Arthrobacter sp. CAU 1506]TJY70729.1 YggS family pyridoxal phosphate-dependent enzyme [Arthrobacter sp. CAU 1506]